MVAYPILTRKKVQIPQFRLIDNDMILPLFYYRPLFTIVQIESSFKDKAFQQLGGEKICSEL